MRVSRIISAHFLLAVLIGCATGSSIVTGTARPAISRDEVEIYLDPPTRYETIGIVEASSAVEFSTQAAQNRAINELKSQAARIGANGVLLMDVGEESGQIVGFYSGGVLYAGASRLKTARGRAILVIEE